LLVKTRETSISIACYKWKSKIAAGHWFKPDPHNPPAGLSGGPNKAGNQTECVDMIYLASPYSHPSADVRHDRFLAAKAATLRLLKASRAVSSYHAGHECPSCGRTQYAIANNAGPNHTHRCGSCNVTWRHADQ
jgi:hypothetical protein